MSMCSLFLNSLVVNAENVFSHDIDVNHPESRERVKLQSKGKLSDAIDLDRETGIKRVVCDGDTVLISVKNHGIGRTWKPGQIILGSSKWDCNANTLDSTRRGIYARIKSIYFPTPTGISIHVEKAGPFDVIEEANIKFEYSPGESLKEKPEVRHRYRRYLSNVLSKILGEINWSANYSTSVPWHIYDGKNSSNVILYSDSGKTIHISDPSKVNNTHNEIFSCTDCGGISEFAYSLHLVISKNEMNEAVIKKYQLQLKGNTSLNMKSSFKFDELKVNISRKISRQPHHVMLSFPVARIPDDRLPPVMLVVSYDASTYLDMSIDSSAKVDVQSDITVKGAYTITQHYTNEKNMSGEITQSDWSITSTNGKFDVEGDLKVKSDLYQKIVFNTSVGWYERDMEIHFSPPIQISIKPNIVLNSSSDDISRCVSSHTGVSGQINVSDAEFIVNAFGVPLWDTLLAKGFSRNVKFPAKAESLKCRADCTAVTGSDNMTDIEQSCGPMRRKILRGTPEFESLVQYYGDSVLFLSEEYNTSSWCGHPGRPCQQCTLVTAGPETESKCADRMMTPKLASSISRLGQLVTAEWPKRKLLVIEAWDEPSSEFPDGQHGDSSIYYEGRAAQLTITDDLDVHSGFVSAAKDMVLHISKLKQLAICAGFDFVSMHDDDIEVGIAAEERRITKRKKSRDYYLRNRESFMNTLHRLEHLVKKSDCQVKTKVLQNLEMWPHTSSSDENDLVGGPLQPIKRNDEKQMERLVEYPFTDIKFMNENVQQTGCGIGIGRNCRNCSKPSKDTNPWNLCSTRVMSPRMAVRLKRLAELLKQDPITDKGKAVRPTVLKAYTSSDIMDKDASKLYFEGRALRLNISNNLSKLGGLAICAGFDFVRNNFGYLEVFVRDQEGFHTTVVSYPSGESFLAVRPPKYFDVPDSFKNAPRIPLLIDAFNKNVKLSPYFEVIDFMEQTNDEDEDTANEHRYLRIDPALVGCLEQVRIAFGINLEILSAYRNRKEIVGEKFRWTENQIANFQIGRAAHVKPEIPAMKKLGLTFLRTCPSTLRIQRLGLALAIGKDSMYVDVHPLDVNKNTQYIELTLMNGASDTLTTEIYDKLRIAWQEMTSGGPDIFPYNEEDACTGTELGEGKEYLVFSFHHLGLCFQFGDNKFCKLSHGARNDAFSQLWKDLSSVSGSNTLPLSAKGHLKDCILTCCGGCPGSGRKWDAKVRSCSAVVTSYLNHSAPLLRPNQRIAFFNTGNINSSAHNLACGHDTTCAENIQLYSVLHTTITKRFKPDENGTKEEEMFGGSDNPSPLLEIVEQELAMAASGVVDVYLEEIQDLSALKNVIKILMIHNTAVKRVVFHRFPEVRESKVVKILQQRLEMWAGSSCPMWSRFAVAPYSIETVSKARHARSLHLSRHRNEAHKKISNWEMDWLMQT